MGFGDGINAWAEDAARAPGREAILEAAIVLLQEHGPASGGLQFRAIGVCDVLGISRTTLYKRWSSMTDVSTDFLCFNAVYADSWMHRMLRTDPAVPFHDVATAIFAPNRPETGVIIRAATSMRPPDDDLRRQAHAADRRWFVQLEDWFTRHLAAQGRHAIPEVTSVQAALLLVTTVAGLALFGGITTRTREMLPRGLDAPTAAALLDGLYQRLTVTGPPRRSGTAHAPSAPTDQAAIDLGPGFSPGKLADLEALTTALFVDSSEELNARILKPVRLVHTRHLARAASLTERRLNAIWPTPADLNGDVGVALARRSLRSTTGVLSTLFTGAADETRDGARRLLPTSMQKMVALGVEHNTVAPFAALSALQDPPVAERLAAECERWLHDLTLVTAATLHALQLDPRPEVNVQSLTSALLAATLGAQRLVAMHPEVLSHTTATGEPLLGFGIAQLLLASAD